MAKKPTAREKAITNLMQRVRYAEKKWGVLTDINDLDLANKTTQQINKLFRSKTGYQTTTSKKAQKKKRQEDELRARIAERERAIRVASQGFYDRQIDKYLDDLKTIWERSNRHLKGAKYIHDQYSILRTMIGSEELARAINEASAVGITPDRNTLYDEAEASIFVSEMTSFMEQRGYISKEMAQGVYQETEIDESWEEPY